MTEEHHPRVIVIFRDVSDPLAQDVAESLQSSGINFESKPLTVEHYNSGGGSHELPRISIIVSSVTAFMGWLATKGFVMFGKSLSIEVTSKDGSTKVTARTVEEVERLLTAAREFQRQDTPAAKTVKQEPQDKK